MSENIEIKLAQLEEPLNVSELTSGTIEGTGVFDVLMKSFNAHIKHEFDKQRIRGPEYAQVYLGGMQTILGVSVDYLLKAKAQGIELENLTKQGALIDAQVEIAIKDAQLRSAQIAGAQADTELTEIQVKAADANLAKIPVEIKLLKNQVKHAEVQVLLTEAQKNQVIYETENKLPVEVANLQLETTRLDKDIALATAQIDKITEENKIIPFQIDKIQAEIAQMTRQSDILEKELELKTSQLALQDKQILLAEAELQVREKEIQVKLAEIDAAKAQAQLYAAKVLTENAQTQATASPGSVLGANISVLNAQADGYLRDAEQKAAKILVDTWNVRRNTDDNEQATMINKLDDTTIGRAMTKLLAGIGINA